MTQPSPTYLNKANLDLKWEAEAQAVQFNSLKNVKTKADEWVKYLPFLLAPINVIAAWIGSEAAKTLSPAQNLLLDFGLVAVAVLSLMAYWMATLAAQVAPKSVITTGSEYRRFIGREAGEAADHLNLSRFLTFGVASLLVITAMSTRSWALPDPASKYAYVYQETGPVLCGAMQTDETTGQLKILVGSGFTTPENVTEIIEVAKCPAIPPSTKKQ